MPRMVGGDPVDLLFGLPSQLVGGGEDEGEGEASADSPQNAPAQI